MAVTDRFHCSFYCFPYNKHGMQPTSMIQSQKINWDKENKNMCFGQWNLLITNILMKCTIISVTHAHEINTCLSYLIIRAIMMTSSNGNIFRVTGRLCGEFTGHRRIPLTKASDAELWYIFKTKVSRFTSVEIWSYIHFLLLITKY